MRVVLAERAVWESARSVKKTKAYYLLCPLTIGGGLKKRWTTKATRGATYSGLLECPQQTSVFSTAVFFQPPRAPSYLPRQSGLWLMIYDFKVALSPQIMMMCPSSARQNHAVQGIPSTNKGAPLSQENPKDQDAAPAPNAEEGTSVPVQKKTMTVMTRLLR